MHAFDELIQSDRFLWEQLENKLDCIDHPPSGIFLDQLKKLILTSSYALDQLKISNIITHLEDLQEFNLQADLPREILSELTDRTRLKAAPPVSSPNYSKSYTSTPVVLMTLRPPDSPQRTSRPDHPAALFKAEELLGHKHSQPVEPGSGYEPNIIGMGKLGGKELNFSSDIDLICCYAEEGQLKNFGQLSYNQYFNQVTKLFKQFLHETTIDSLPGDLRLRPWEIPDLSC